MKKAIPWAAAAVILMIGCPWLAVTFAGTSGMAICFLLFFAVNPLFSAMCGFFAGKQIRQLWMLPLIVAFLYLAGAWLFFDMGEPAFLLYCGAYLIIGIIFMLVHALWNQRKQ